MPWVVAKVAIIAGLKPIFVDVDSQTCNIDPTDIQRKITPNTRYLLVVHLHGIPCDMTAIQHIVTDHHLTLIEDCAQALGSTYQGQKLGTFGTASYFSFGSSQHPTTFGGGMITTNNTDLAITIRTKTNQLPYPTKLELTKRFILSTIKYTWNSPSIVTCIGYPLISCLPQRHKDALLKRMTLPAPIPQDIDTYTETTLHHQNGYRYTNFQATLGLHQLKTHDHLLQAQAHTIQTLHHYLKPTIPPTAIIPSTTYSCHHTTNQQETTKVLLQRRHHPLAGLLPRPPRPPSLPPLCQPLPPRHQPPHQPRLPPRSIPLQRKRPQTNRSQPPTQPIRTGKIMTTHTQTTKTKSLKILFVQPSSPSSKVSGKKLSYKLNMYPPLTFEQLTGITPNDCDVTIIDERFQKLTYNIDADLIGISCMTPEAPRAYEIADEFRRAGHTVVLGGWHALRTSSGSRPTCRQHRHRRSRNLMAQTHPRLQKPYPPTHLPKR